MAIMGCCETVREKLNEWGEAKDKWIGGKVAWLLGERQYTVLQKMGVDFITYTLGVAAISTAFIASLNKESTPEDTKIIITVAACVVMGTAVIAALFNEIIYRYQPNPPRTVYSASGYISLEV